MWAGVPSGSIEGPLLFNLFTFDLSLFLTETYVGDYADDNSLFKMGRDQEFVREILRKDFKTVVDWFYHNYVVKS